MSTSLVEISPDSKKAARRFGYVLSIVINVAMLVIVQNLLEWGWPAFLTAEFAEVVPWISFSLVASIVANIIYQIDGSDRGQSDQCVGDVHRPHSLPVRLLRLPIRLRGRDQSRPHPRDSRSRCRGPRRGHQARIDTVGSHAGRQGLGRHALEQSLLTWTHGANEEVDFR